MSSKLKKEECVLTARISFFAPHISFYLDIGLFVDESDFYDASLWWVGARCRPYLIQ